MKRTPIAVDIDAYPSQFRSLLRDAEIYDSSCSAEARVIFIDRDCGYFLKSASKGKLKKEAELTGFFHKKELAANGLSYVSEEQDWLLTERVAGEDCTHRAYLENAERLCDVLAERLRLLHETDLTGCPVPDRMSDYLATARSNYVKGICDLSFFAADTADVTPQDAWKELCENGRLLKNEVLLHGDYCLPNIILDDWRFSGFIDLGNGGVGDRHVDLFWGAWTLAFNLKTDKYRERFFDAYGRDKIEPALLKTVAAAEVFG